MASDLPILAATDTDEPQRRAEFVAGLRSLARFIERNPAAPLYLFGSGIGIKREVVEIGVHVHDAAEYDAFKRRFAIDGGDVETDAGYVHAIRHFGPYVTYGVQRSTR
jgi:hypothetical protein